MGAITSQEWPRFISEWVFLQNLDNFYPELISFNIFPLITMCAITLSLNSKCGKSSRVYKVLQEEKGLSKVQRPCSTRKETLGKSRGADGPSSEVMEEKLPMDQRGLCRVSAAQESTELSETWRKKESNCSDSGRRNVIVDFFTISSHLQLSLFKEKNSKYSNIYSHKIWCLFSLKSCGILIVQCKKKF